MVLEISKKDVVGLWTRGTGKVRTDKILRRP
jgi:hypothetical protein